MYLMCMNSDYSNVSQEREIDIIDMFWYWLSHFKSLIVFLLVGAVVGVALYMMAPKPVATDDANATTNEAANDTSDSTANAITKPEPYKKGADFDVLLSESQKVQVDQVVDLTNKYNELINNYNNSDYALKDKAESFEYITHSKYSIDKMLKEFSQDQLKYYYTQLGKDTLSQKYGDTVVANATNATKTDASTVKKSSGGTTKLIICIVVALVLHILIFVIAYIFDKKIKYRDNPSAMLRTNEFSKVIDWNKINSKGAITKAIIKARLSGERMTPYEEALLVNANTIVDIASKNEYSTISIITDGLQEEGDALKKLIEDNSSISVSVVDNITHNALGAKTVTDAQSVVLLGKVNETKMPDVFEEGVAVKSREIDLLGVIVYV